jgi:hypothetical protein
MKPLFNPFQQTINLISMQEGNGHYLYTVSTPEHQFYVREEEADLMEEGQKVSYKTH